MREQPIRVAAVGDVHAAEFTRATVETAFVELSDHADVLLLAGDLTAVGTPEEAAILAATLKDVDIPKIAVLGNHDWHEDRAREVVEAVAEGGIRVIERQAVRLDIDGCSVGVVGLKGFVGGFQGSHLPDFGEPLLRRVYRETSDDVEALDAGLREIAGCDRRIVLLHYAPTTTTLEGEPQGIHAFLGNDRLAVPIAEHRPDLVVHGHAHIGTYEGSVDGVPCFNVAQPLLGQPYAVFSLGAVPAEA
jgi:Icc-related predicted phosphoesterase